jgi:Protein of unknown function (DUF2891)
VGTGPPELAHQWHQLLRDHAAQYAQVAIENIGREFPAHLVHLMTRPGDFPQCPADRSPVFYGSLDWHSCVEMHWVLVRLLRLVPDAIPADEVRALLDGQLQASKLAAEAEFVASDDGRHERPYGWAWALALAAEIGALAAGQADADAARWLAAMAPLEAAVVAGFGAWLPKATYPIRYGVHHNSAFAFTTLLPYARERAPALAAAVSARALRWFGDDLAYPAEFEPSGHDFLSPALTEAVLMSRLLEPVEFASWLELFLPTLSAGSPRQLFTPAVVSDPSEGHIAHLHGLNASRAWCWRELARSLPPEDPRTPHAVIAATTHLKAALPHVTGSDYMVAHWLAAYAVLALS